MLQNGELEDRPLREKKELVALIKRSAIRFVARQAFKGAGDSRRRLAELRAAVSGEGVRQAAPSHPANDAQGEPGVPETSHDKLTVNFLCSYFGVSRRHLTRLFRAQTGDSPGRWLRTVRANAARLLRSDGRPLKTVASRLGYKGRSSAWRLVQNAK